jgi:hypothetical protein
MTFLKQHYGPSEGPLGFPMLDKAAQALDVILRSLPKSAEFAYRKTVQSKPPTELLTGERADVSWITSEDPDRANEVVLARGMDDSQFKLNPIVTLQHAYHLPPVGRSLWRKVVRDGERFGVKAKTHYPPRPVSWPGDTWPADAALALVQADLLRGKSIGFLPTKVHTPAQDERQHPGWANVELVIDEWILLEYACCFLPCQQNAVVEAVSKSLPIPDDFLKVLGIDPATVSRSPLSPGGSTNGDGVGGEEATELPANIGYLPLEEIETALERALARIDFADLAEKMVATQLDPLRGRV